MAVHYQLHGPIMLGAVFCYSNVNAKVVFIFVVQVLNIITDHILPLLQPW